MKLEIKLVRMKAKMKKKYLNLPVEGVVAEQEREGRVEVEEVALEPTFDVVSRLRVCYINVMKTIETDFFSVVFSCYTCV